LASIFGTLLSSQESHAHQHNTTRHHIGATVQTYPPQGLPHKSTPDPGINASCGAVASVHCNRPEPIPRSHCRDQVAPEVPVPFRWFHPCYRGGVRPPGPATSPGACAPAAVVSVPPCRADLQNFRTYLPSNTNPLVTGVKKGFRQPFGRRPGTCVLVVPVPPDHEGSPPR
jgi:hypothetical protein